MLTITVQDQALQDYLTRLQRRLGNLKPVMQGIATTMEKRVSQRFETQTDPNGQPWKAWKPATLAAYPKRGAVHGRLLDRYGDMLDSLNSIATADTARIGFGAVGSVEKDAYAVYHEFGTANMARRGLLFGEPDEGALGLSDSFAIEELLSNWLNSAID